MNIPVLLLVSFLAALYPVASWGSTCPSLEIQTKQISGLPASSNFNHTYFTVPLSQIQTNITYQLSISFAQVTFSQFETQIRLAIGATAKNTSYIQMVIVGAYSGKYLSLLKVSYLVVPSDYSHLITTFVVISDYLNQAVAPQGSLDIYRSLPNSLDSPDFLFASYLCNIDMLTTSPQLDFGIDYSIMVLNTTSYKITIRNIAQNSITYYFLDRVIVIAYHSRFPAGTSVSLSYLTYPILSASNVLVQSTNTLLGLVSFSARNGTNFSWSVTAQKSQVFLGNSTQTSWLIVTFNVFSNGQCCGFTPYIDMVNKRCSSSCLANTTVQTCFLCQRNSKFNTQTKVCEDCSAQSVLNYANGTCLPCSANTFLDSSSNTCRQCPPYTFLNSQFFCEPCPDNYFFNLSSNVCESCGFLLLNRSTGLCDRCADGQYLNLVTLTCQSLSNSSQNSSCNGGRSLHYTLLVESVARKFTDSVLISPETCQARILFNGQAIGSISPTNNSPQKSFIPVQLIQGENTLTIESTSYEDGLGLIIGKVKLYSFYNSSDLIINGDFSSSISNQTGNYPGWSCAKPEIGICTAYNDEWSAFNYTNTSKCIELQSDSNQNYTQTIKISASLKCSLLNQAQQSIKLTVNSSTQANAIRSSLLTPPRKYFSEATFQYESCPFDCYSCSNDGALCTSCNSDSDFRTLSLLTNRCEPLPGYSNDGNSSTARRCEDSSCVSCSYLYKVCLGCRANTTLFNNTCVGCYVDDCAQCRSTNSCLACTSGYSLLDNHCFSCSIQDCLFCSDNDKCNICASGRQLLNNSCISCNVSNCLRCGPSNKCDLCSNNFTLNSAFVCVPCSISECVKCQSSNVCQLCIDYAKLKDNRCVCQDGYALNQGSCIKSNQQGSAGEDKAINSYKYLGIGSVIGLTASLLLLAIFLFIKKTNSTAVVSMSLDTNETKINQTDEIKHIENNQTHQEFKKKVKREEIPKDKELKFEQFEDI